MSSLASTFESFDVDIFFGAIVKSQHPYSRLSIGCVPGSPRQDHGEQEGLAAKHDEGEKEVEKKEVEEAEDYTHDDFVYDFFHCFVEPCLEDAKPEDMDLAAILGCWAERRYKQFCAPKPDPTMEDLRNPCKEIEITYQIEDPEGPKEIQLFIVVEYRGRDGFRVNLKSKISGSVAQLGSYCFPYDGKDADAPRMPKIAWLLIDMIHMLMLVSEGAKADKIMIKKWFVDMKVFLNGFNAVEA